MPTFIIGSSTSSPYSTYSTRSNSPALSRRPLPASFVNYPHSRESSDRESYEAPHSSDVFLAPPTQTQPDQLPFSRYASFVNPYVPLKISPISSRFPSVESLSQSTLDEAIEKNARYLMFKTKGDAVLCRTPVLYRALADSMCTLRDQCTHPIAIVIDGDAQAKSALSVRLAQLKRLEETRGIDLTNRQSRTAILKELNQEFPIYRRDVSPSDVEQGMFIVKADLLSLQASGLLDTARKMIKNPEVNDSYEHWHMDSELLSTLGHFEQGDVMALKNKIDPNKPSIRITENIWHKLHKDSREFYAEQIKKSLAPGSLLVLGGAERDEANVYPYLEDAFNAAGGAFRKMSLYNRLYPYGGFNPNDSKLILRANTVSDGNYSVDSTWFEKQRAHALVKKF